MICRGALLSLLLLVLPMLTGCLSFHRGALPGEPKTATFADVGGARVHFVDVGQGPAIVMIHGFAASLETWKGIIPELAKTHRVLALDLKGFGWTDRPEGDYSPQAQAELVLALLSYRGIDRAAVVGHSWGASVALAMALMAPDRVTKLALYDAWVYEEQLPTTFHWARASGVGETIFALFYTERAEDKMALAFYDKKYVTEDLVDAVESALDRPGSTAAALAAVRGQRYAEVQTRYRSITQPTLLLWGREDTVTPIKYGERLSLELPHVKLVVYPRCGHFPMIEAKSASDAELRAFLTEPSP
jgi:pimeloyl-ACP methyl ester carboxylesterase